MYHSLVKFRKQTLLLLALATVLVLSCMLPQTVHAAGGLSMSTDYPGITVKAGDSLSFDLDFTNNSGTGDSVALSIASIPEGWSGYFEGGGQQISRVYAKSGENEAAATFSVDVPIDAAQGEYTIILNAEGSGMNSSLALILLVNEEELGRSALTTQYAEQEGTESTSFSFSSTIQNNTPSEQSYSLAANAPAGWQVSFTPAGESTQVAAIAVPARSSQGITIAVTPAAGVEAGTYTIPIAATGATETLTGELTVVITETYSIDLSTPSGRLSFDANANRQTAVTLSVTNNSNVDLQNLNLSSTVADGWTVEFSQTIIDTLAAGATTEVTAYVTPSKDSLAGDYVVILSVKGNEASDTAEFRVAVKTDTVWGIVGVVLILLAAAGLWLVFKKYGRR